MRRALGSADKPWLPICLHYKPQNKSSRTFFGICQVLGPREKILTFCGTFPVSQYQAVAYRFNHILQMYGVTNNGSKLQLLNIFSKTQYRGVNLTLSFRDQGLQTGTTLVLLACDGPISTELQTGLANPPYAKQ